MASGKRTKRRKAAAAGYARAASNDLLVGMFRLPWRERLWQAVRMVFKIRQSSRPVFLSLSARRVVRRVVEQETADAGRKLFDALFAQPLKLRLEVALRVLFRRRKERR